jgi:hypothetical protein
MAATAVGKTKRQGTSQNSASRGKQEKERRCGRNAKRDPAQGGRIRGVNKGAPKTL